MSANRIKVYLICTPIPYRVNSKANNTRPGDVSSFGVPENMEVILPRIATCIVGEKGGVWDGTLILVSQALHSSYLHKTCKNIKWMRHTYQGMDPYQVFTQILIGSLTKFVSGLYLTENCVSRNSSTSKWPYRSHSVWAIEGKQ